MASTKKSATSAANETAAAPAESKPAAARPKDALVLLKNDHTEVKKLFKAYQKLADKEADAQERQPLAQQICMMLTIHTALEEEIFYPQAREMLPPKGVDMIDEADVEHASCKNLIAEIESMGADDPLYDAKVKVLGQYIDHHVQEEQDELFPMVKESGMNTRAMGAEMMARKEELMAEQAVEA